MECSFVVVFLLLTVNYFCVLPQPATTGDMNVAATYKDGSHWEKRPQEGKTSAETSGVNSFNDGEIYEWFRDEAKCLSRFEHGGPPKLPENVGIPGFTPAERKRFATFLEEGNFCDVWRKLMPDGNAPLENESSQWERGNYTWRGHLGKNGGYSKYQGKGQRIDYFLLSPKEKVEEVFRCNIVGHGTNREKFWGSDHCAMGLMFHYEDPNYSAITQKVREQIEKAKPMN